LNKNSAIVPNSRAIARCGLRRKVRAAKIARRRSLLSNTYEIVKSANVKSLKAKNEKKNISGLATNAK
jgi:hypothetical protein